MQPVEEDAMTGGGIAEWDVMGMGVCLDAQEAGTHVGVGQQVGEVSVW
jgi:hypothetical protein